MAGEPMPAPYEALHARFVGIEAGIAKAMRQIMAARTDQTSRPHRTAAVDVGNRTDDTYYTVATWQQGYGQSDVLFVEAGLQFHWPETHSSNGHVKFRLWDGTNTLAESSSISTTSILTQDELHTISLQLLHTIQINEWDARNTPDDSDLRTTPIAGTVMHFQAKRVDGIFRMIVTHPHIRYSTPEVYPDATDVGVWTFT